ncbi:NUDIX hydrolase [Terrarubrum flagellatum]|uniref:NUDIX hydrolase n=1 Tax=Terrirubrum flagellatum TaxID=2895980 RepID=UPI00314549FF
MAESSTRPVIAASIAVFRDDGRVLLAMRGQPPLAELWSLPGGKVELGETLAEAALRELKEEVGVEADLVGFNDHVEFIARDQDGAVKAHFVIASFVGRWRAGEAQPGPEARAVKWVDPFDPGDLKMTDGLPRILRQAAVIAAKADIP